VGVGAASDTSFGSAMPCLRSLAPLWRSAISPSLSLGGYATIQTAGIAASTSAGRRAFASSCGIPIARRSFEPESALRAVKPFLISIRSIHTPAPLPPVALNTLSDNAGAVRNRKRVGRGIGSGRGKTCGRGHKGQNSRTGGGVRPGFEGGQTPLHRRLPKRGFNNKKYAVDHRTLNLGRLQEWIDAGRLDTSKLITMKDLKDSKCVAGTIKEGIKLLADGKSIFTSTNVRIEVSRVSEEAKAHITSLGGEATAAYYNRLGLRALLQPEKFLVIPKRARPPPRLAKFYAEWPQPQPKPLPKKDKVA